MIASVLASVGFVVCILGVIVINRARAPDIVNDGVYVLVVGVGVLALAAVAAAL